MSEIDDKVKKTIIKSTDDFSDLEIIGDDKNNIEVKKPNKQTEKDMLKIPNIEDTSAMDNITEGLTEWLSGNVLVPEKEIEKFLKSTTDKARVVNSYVVLSGMGRIGMINQFIDAYEREMFDPSRLPDLTDKEKSILYRMAVTRAKEIVDMNNEYLAQDTGLDEDTQRIITIAKSLSPDAIKKVSKMIKDLSVSEALEVGEDE